MILVGGVVAYKSLGRLEDPEFTIKDAKLATLCRTGRNVQRCGPMMQLDYRLEQTAAGWKIYDVNVLGVWLVENYRNSFSQEIVGAIRSAQAQRSAAQGREGVQQAGPGDHRREAAENIQAIVVACI